MIYILKDYSGCLCGMASWEGEGSKVETGGSVEGCCNDTGGDDGAVGQGGSGSTGVLRSDSGYILKKN